MKQPIQKPSLKQTNNHQQNKETFIIFSNRHLEHHSNDGSILAWKGSQIMYVSAKGIKNCLSLQLIAQNQQLSQRIEQCLQKFNRYCTHHQYYVFTHNEIKQGKSIPNNYKLYLLKGQHLKKEMIKKPMKIGYYSWCQAEIQESDSQANAFIIYSDDRNASLTLHSNLYTITVRYLQFVSSNNAFRNSSVNYTKLLMQKYNYEYTEFPQATHPHEKDIIEYQYFQHQKEYCIFNIPFQWRYPLHLLWTSLIEHRVFSHQFCYLTFTKQQMCTKVQMPKISELSSIQTHSDSLRIPILGKTTHTDICNFIKIGNSRGWYSQQINLLSDGVGFWTFDKSSPLIFYRKINKMIADQQFHPNTVPYKIRFENQQQRSVSHQIKIFLSYFSDNLRKQDINAHKNVPTKDACYKFDSQGKLVSEYTVAEVGQFKAYSNGIIYVKFVDRFILTLNSRKMEVKLMDNKGESYYISLANPEGPIYKQYQDYLNYAIDFQDQIFYPNQWQKKQKLRSEIISALEETETLQKINKMLLK